MGIYQTRWSAKRLHKRANAIKGKKRDVISKSSFRDLLHISPLVPPLEALVDFIVMRIDTKKCLLKLNDRKKIYFTRDMVNKKILNVPSGSKPLEFGKRRKLISATFIWMVKGLQYPPQLLFYQMRMMTMRRPFIGHGFYFAYHWSYLLGQETWCL